MPVFNKYQLYKDYLQFLDEVFAPKVYTMDELLVKVNERGYVLQDWDIVKANITFNINPKYEGMPFIVKRTHFEQKDPLKDTFNYDLIIGMDYYAKKRTILPIYLKGEFLGKQKLEWPSHHTNFKERKATAIFPGYMTIEERKKWRRDYEKVLAGKKPSELYLEHYHAIKDLNPKFII